MQYKLKEECACIANSSLLPVHSQMLGDSYFIILTTSHTGGLKGRGGELFVRIKIMHLYKFTNTYYIQLK